MMVDVRRSRARDVGIVLVLALLAVDAVLVVMALRDPPEPPAVTVADAPSVAATETPSAEPTPTETPTPTPTEAEPVLATARELPLSVLDGDAAVRSTDPGVCGEGVGTVERTDDGGVTWTQYEGPDLAVLRVRIRPDEVWFVGADEACRADFARSEDGQEWTLSGRTQGVFHLLGDTAVAELHVPVDEVVSGPCADLLLVELESLGDIAHVLCGDGTVHSTSNAGGAWSLVGTVPGALAMGLRDGQPVVAAAGVEGCAGLAVQAFEGDVPVGVGCAESAPQDGVALAFAEGGGAGFLVAGGLTWTTDDGGVTWTSVT